MTAARPPSNFSAQRARSYPYWSRTFPSDTINGELWIQLVDNIGGNWSNIAVISVIDVLSSFRK